MRAVVVQEYGTAPVVSEVAEPDGELGEVLARLRWCATRPTPRSCASSAGLDATLSAAAIRANGVTIHPHANPQLPERVRSEAFARLARHAAAGELVAEYREIGLDALPAIWDDFAAGKVPTKTIVKPNE